MYSKKDNRKRKRATSSGHVTVTTTIHGVPGITGEFSITNGSISTSSAGLQVYIISVPSIAPFESIGFNLNNCPLRCGVFKVNVLS